MDSGAAYVFVREGASFAEQAYLKPSMRGSGARFGHVVAIDGDTIAVDAPSRGAGAVYVFTRSGTVWQEQARLESADPESNGKFGLGLALRGELFGSDTAPADFFGDSVAVEGDSVLVGASWASPTAFGAGVVYVYARNDQGTFDQTARLGASNPGVDAFFGERIALAGDALVVGATEEGSSASGINGDLTGPALARSRCSATRSSWALDSEASAARGVDGDAADDTAPGSGALFIVR